MAVPVLTVRSARPRVFFRDTDRSALQTRRANASGWKTYWDGAITSYATTYRNRGTDYTWIATTNPHLRIMPLVVKGYLDEDSRVAGGFRDRAIGAASYLCDVADNVTPTNFRYRCLCLAAVFDAFYADMTAAERTKIAAELVAQANRATGREDEKVDGHSGNDQMCRLACALAGHGFGTTDWTAMVDGVLSFWYETGIGRMEAPRYFGSDGGDHKGAAYSYLGHWSDILMTWMLDRATDWDSFTAEASWMEKTWESLIWSSYTGGPDFDFESHGDTTRLTDPLFPYEMRWLFSVLMSKFPAPDGTQGDEHLRWIYDQWIARETQTGDYLSWDFLFFDRAAVAATAPEDATTPPSTARLFAPPGIFYARESWDHENSSMVRLSGRNRYDLGHRHQDAGSIAITFKGRPLLLSPSGRYDVYDSVPHHGNWYQRSLGQSGALLVYDPAQTYTFYSKARENEGGQQLKKYVHPTRGEESDAWNVQEMLQDAGGLAWKRSDFSVVAQSGDHRFLVCDHREAHKRYHTDTPRFSVAKTSVLRIAPTVANGLNYQALLVYLRVAKNTNSWRTCVPWHFRGAITTRSFGADGTDVDGVGRLWIDIRDIGSYTVTNEGRGTPLDANGYGPTQFRNYFTAVNYPPSLAIGDRHDPWCKRNTLWVEQTVRAAEERYVFLLMIDDYAAGEPATGRAWSTDGADPDWYKITLGTVTYGIHRTLDQCTFGDAVDTTPPAEVTAQTLAARDRALLYTFTDPADGDLAGVEVQVRTSEIT